MADLAAGEVFVDAGIVNGTRLNNHVNGATILPGFISRLTATTPVAADFVVWGSADGTIIKKVTITNLFSLITSNAAAGTPSLRSIGTTSVEAAPGNILALANTFTGLTQTFKHISATAAGSIAADSAGLGSTGTATRGSGSGDLAGFITLTPGGTGIGTSSLAATITFGTAYASGPWVFLVPYNQAAIAAMQGAKAVNAVADAGGANFTITTGSAALTSGTDYQFQYLCVI